MKISKFRVVAIIFLLFGCVSNASDTAEPSKELAGLWRNKYEDADSVILRRPDGTFVEKKVVIYDFSKSAATVNSVGKWRLNRDYYILEYTESSHPVWKRAIGKTIRFEVQNISQNEFRYKATDGGMMTEKKIGIVSEGAFNRATVSLSGVKAK